MTATAFSFPAERIPDDPAHAKLLGIYPQRQPGIWLQRVKVIDGRLTPQQWKSLAAIACRFTPHTPLHLTTRQDIEIHDLKAEDVPLVQTQLSAAGLTCLGAAGDTVRNITVCPCSGTTGSTPDLAPLAEQVRQMLEAQSGIYSLPRKFKISLSACDEACAQPYINDLGLVASRKDGAWGFRVIVAGSLGARPNAGIELFDWLAAGDVLPLALAAIRVFAEHGDRTNRAKARLRHVRERLGDPAFTTLLIEAFQKAKSEQSWPDVTLSTGAVDYDAKVTLNFLGGDVSIDAAEALAGLAAQPDVQVRITNHHRIMVYATNQASLAGHLAASEALAQAARPQPAIVACPGTRWCKHGLVDTLAMAKRIAELPAGTIPATAAVCISGCPNGCAQNAVADIGLSGVLTTENGVRHEAYSVLAGGAMGRREHLALPVAQRLKPEDVIDWITVKRRSS